MKKRFISMICALAMVFSVISGFSIISANAADATITGTASYNQTTKKATIKVSYSGLNKIKSFDIAIPIDTDVFEAPTLNTDGEVSELTYADNFTLGGSNYVNSTVKTAFLATKASQYVIGESGDLFTLELTVKDESKLPYTLKLGSIALADAPDVGDVSYGTADQNPGVVIAVVNPIVSLPATPTPTAGPATATPTATPTARPTINPSARPTKAPVATATAEATTTPTAEATVAPTAVPATNITGTATYDETTKKATIKVSYNGLNKIKSFDIAIPIDTDVFEAPTLNVDGEVSELTYADNFKLGGSNYVNSTVKTAFLATKASQYVVGESGDLFTLELTVKDVTKLPYTLKLGSIALADAPDTGDISYGTADQNPGVVIAVVNPVVAIAATPTAEPTATPTAAPTATPKPAVSTIVVSKVIAVDNSLILPANEVGVKIDFKDASGNTLNLVYGTDFVLADEQGNEFSADAYNNIVNGYDTTTLKSLLTGNAQFKIYNNKVAAVTSSVIDYTTNDYVGNETTADVTVVATPTPTATATAAPSTNGTWHWSSSSSVKVDNTITLDAQYTVDGTKYSGNDISYEITSGTSYASLSGRSLKGKKAGTVTITATCGDATTKKSITVSSSSSSSSSSGSTSSGNVASGNTGTTTTTPNTTVSFNDIWSVPWAETAIKGLAAKGVINGKTSTEFDPEANVTRAEFAKMLIATFGMSNISGASSSFSDVPTSHWAYNYISIANQLGAITGYDESTFGPDDNITRQDMAVMVYRLVTKYNYQLTISESAIAFTDDAQIASYAKDAITTLQTADVINGMDDGSFAPNATATRAQAAVLLYKFVK